MQFHAIIPVADDFGLYVSHGTGDGNIGALSLSIKATTVAIGYQLVDTLDRNNSKGVQGLIALGASSSKATIGAISSSDDSGRILGRLTGYLGPKIRGTIQFSSDTSDFDPTFSFGLGYEVGPGILGVSYTSDKETSSGVTLEMSEISFGYTLEF